MTTKRATSRNAGKSPAAARVPRAQMAQTQEGRLGLVLGACERALRPLVRLALAFGVKHAQLEDVLRDAMLDEARRAWRTQGIEPNVSQLSVTTGLNRKALASRVREARDPLPQTETSAASKTLTLWLQLFADDPAQHALPIMSSDESTPSFEAVARHASRGNVHHRAILDELVRLNMATEQDGMAQLAVESFVPAGDLEGLLSFLGDNARDHMLAGVSNTVGAKEPMLEQSVFATGISLQECERIHRLARERWAGLHRDMTREMRQAFEAADSKDSGRIRIGIYAYLEDVKAEQGLEKGPPRDRRTAPGKTPAAARKRQAPPLQQRPKRR